MTMAIADPLAGDSSSVEQDRLEPIAVIGLSATFPQDATSAEAFWKMLIEARSAMTDVPGERYNVEAFYHPDGERGDAV